MGCLKVTPALSILLKTKDRIFSESLAKLGEEEARIAIYIHQLPPEKIVDLLGNL